MWYSHFYMRKQLLYLPVASTVVGSTPRGANFIFLHLTQIQKECENESGKVVYCFILKQGLTSQ